MQNFGRIMDKSFGLKIANHEELLKGNKIKLKLSFSIEKVIDVLIF